MSGDYKKVGNNTLQVIPKTRCALAKKKEKGYQRNSPTNKRGREKKSVLLINSNYSKYVNKHDRYWHCSAQKRI